MLVSSLFPYMYLPREFPVVSVNRTTIVEEHSAYLPTV